MDRRLALALITLALLACSRPEPSKPVEAPRGARRATAVVTSAPVVTATPVSAAPSSTTAPSSATAPSTATAPPALERAGEMVDLEVPGYGAAVVAVPAEGPSPHPVVVAAHANWDRPSWECSWWRRHFPRSFLLCPRGILREDSPSKDDPRFTYESDDELEAELDAGLKAMKTRWAGHVAEGPMTWVALSRGAYLGGFIASRRPGRFPRLILVEGGQDPWTPANAKAFAEGGGRRVLFICGQGACRVQARPAAARLIHFGAEAKIVEVPGMGHGLNGDADAVVVRHRAWLFE